MVISCSLSAQFDGSITKLIALTKSLSLLLHYQFGANLPPILKGVKKKGGVTLMHHEIIMMTHAQNLKNHILFLCLFSF